MYYPERIVLDPDVYDTLELSALAFGGIGASEYFDDHWTPCCIVGHCQMQFKPDVSPIIHTLRHAGLTEGRSDDAVARINACKLQSLSTRVTWEEYCAALHIERGV